MYVPDEQRTAIVTSQVPSPDRTGSLRSEIACTETVTGSRFTSLPALAARYKRSPSTFLAEYIGGVWSCSPLNSDSTNSMSPRLTAFDDRSGVVCLPVRS